MAELKMRFGEKSVLKTKGKACVCLRVCVAGCIVTRYVLLCACVF